MAASPFPLSARDTVEFRPATAAVIAARAALEDAQAAAGPATDEVAPDDLAAKVQAAQAALEAAEAEQAKADPIFMLRVPTGRTKALVQRATSADPDAPRLRDNAELLAAIEAEARDAGLLDDDLAAIAEAKPLVAAGKMMDGELWSRVFAAAQDTAGGRRIIADRVLYSELHARHRIAHHLVLDGQQHRPLSERDLDSVERYLPAINAEIERLSTLAAADAKNSAAP